MAQNVQQLIGYFKRFKKGVPLHKAPLQDTLEKLCNIAEGITGLNGIVIGKPQGEGHGWTITLDYSATNLLPTGTTTAIVLRWDDPSQRWYPDLPIDPDDDETETTQLAENDRVVIGLQVGDGGVIQAVTAPLGPGGGSSPADFDAFSADTTAPTAEIDTTDLVLTFATKNTIDGTAGTAVTLEIPVSVFSD
jgi:hypothetical protein